MLISNVIGDLRPLLAALWGNFTVLAPKEQSTICLCVYIYVYIYIYVYKSIWNTIYVLYIYVYVHCPRILLINALISSHLNYCSVGYMRTTAVWSTKMYQLCGKVASNGKYLKRAHVTPLLWDLKWINFNSILRLNEASFIYENVYVSADSNMKKINFDLRNKVSQRITRNGSDEHID